MTQKTKLYRHFNAEGKLLYVGVSVSAIHRLQQHRNSPWIEDVTRIDIEHFENRDDALIAEKQAIKAEEPLFNKAHKPRSISEIEELFSCIFEGKAFPDLSEQAIYFNNQKTRVDFLQKYRKYAHRREMQIAKAKNYSATTAHQALSS